MAGSLSRKRLAGAARVRRRRRLGTFVPALVLSALVVAVLDRVIVAERVAARRRAPRRAVAARAAGGPRVFADAVSVVGCGATRSRMALRGGRLVLCAAAALALGAIGQRSSERVRLSRRLVLRHHLQLQPPQQRRPDRLPGQPGRSHNHTYLGNTSVHAFTTAAVVARRRHDVRARGRRLDVLGADALRRHRADHPAGGDRLLRQAHVRSASSRSRRTEDGGRQRQREEGAVEDRRRVELRRHRRQAPRFSALPACRVDQALELRMHFPNCWNGKTLDSPDHKRHMAYSSAGVCPGSIPFRCRRSPHPDLSTPCRRVRGSPREVRRACRLHERVGRGRPGSARHRPQLRLTSSVAAGAARDAVISSTGPTPCA